MVNRVGKNLCAEAFNITKFLGVDGDTDSYSMGVFLRLALSNDANVLFPR